MPRRYCVESVRRHQWMWILGGALAGVILHGAAGWWSPSGVLAQGNTTITATNSTTHHTSNESPPACQQVGTSRTETSVTTTTTIGPATIFVGEDQSVPFFVAAGTLNINTNTHTETFTCIPAVPALPPPALLGGGMLLAGLGAWRLRRRRHAVDDTGLSP